MNDSQPLENQDDPKRPAEPARQRKRLRPAQPIESEQDAKDLEARKRTKPYLGDKGGRKDKADTSYMKLMEAGIPELELQFGLGEKKSYTVAAPQGAAVAGCGTIQVLLVSSSFYVNKLCLPTESWSEEFASMYKVRTLAPFLFALIMPWLDLF